MPLFGGGGQQNRSLSDVENEIRSVDIGRGAFTSDLTAQEFWLVQDQGYTPLALVMGNSVFSMGVVGGLATALRGLGRGELTEYTQLMYDARQLALARMKHEADELGGDGIVGVDFQITSHGTDIMEVWAIGTAIKYTGRREGQAQGSHAQVVMPVSGGGLTRAQMAVLLFRLENSFITVSGGHWRHRGRQEGSRQDRGPSPSAGTGSQDVQEVEDVSRGFFGRAARWKGLLMAVPLALAPAGAAVLGLAPQAVAAAAAAPSWSQPQQVLTLSGTLQNMSPVVVDGGKHYLVAYLGGDPILVTDAGGTWQQYDTGVTDMRATNSEGIYALAVSGGVAYIPYMDTKGDLKLAYDPAGPSGTWSDVTVVPGGAQCGPGQETEAPSAAVVSSILAVAFDDGGPCTGGHSETNDVYVAAAPLSALTAGASPSWQVSQVTTGSSNGGVYPAVAADGGSLDLTYQVGGYNGAIGFVKGTPGGANGFTWPASPQQAATVSNQGMDRPKMTLAASNGVDVTALGAGGNVVDTWAATNAGGSWGSSALFKNNNTGGERPTAAVGLCGPMVAYTQNASPGPAQVVVATMTGGQWTPQTIGAPEQSLDAMWPGVAATPSGADLVWVNDDSGSPVLNLASANCSLFNDLGGYGWAAGAINTLAQQGIVNGTAPGTFSPAGQVTRAQFAALMQRLFSLPAPAQAVAFSDVPQSFWGYAAVEAASPYFDYFQVPGGGYAFHPNDPFDRQDVATVIVRLLAKAGKLQVLAASDAQTVLAKVTDASSIAPALQPYVATAIKAGIMAGFPDGTFQPQGQSTRAQVAVLLQRLENSFITVSGGH